jgi:CRP/FNR family transcriptional regulator, anaerobic regulatory protein
MRAENPGNEWNRSDPEKACEGHGGAPHRSKLLARPHSPASGGTSLADSARFALHRPELLGALLRGDDKVALLMKDSSIALARETLVEANKGHRFVYRLVKGWAGRTRLLPDGRNQLILIFLPGDLIAVKSMFLTHQPDAVVAVSAIRTERIDHRKLYAAFVADSDIAMRCVWQIVEEERRLHSWVAGHGQGSAEERLALLLLDLRGRLILSGAIPAHSLTYPMPLTQVQLAEHLGITPVHVSRVLKDFRDHHVVQVRDGRVTIAHLHKLTQKASALLDLYERTNPAYVD